MLKYKGYIGHLVFDDDAEIFHGEVINTKDVITFQGKSVEEIKKEFEESIDDYLEFCESRNEKPDKPFSGKLSLRLDPEVHQKVYIAAKEENKSLNSWIVDSLLQRIHALL